MAWPTYSRTTLKPLASATSWTARPTSCRAFPFLSCSIPAHRLRSVTSISFWASAEIFPMPMVKAASPWYPSTMAPQSMERMSPSSNR
jgi:hypothetical protein